MKNLSTKLLFALFAICLLLTLITGCTTTSGDGTSANPVRDEKIAASVEYAAQVATYAVLKDRPRDKKHFLTAADAIDSIVASGSINPELIQDIVQATAKDSAEAALAINGALVIYRIWWADYVKDEIAQSPTALKILTALSAGIRAGASGPALAAEPGARVGEVEFTVKLPTKALQDAFDSHVRRYSRGTQ